MNEIKKIPPPICVKERQSGIELLRLIAMFLVIGVHANFLALGEPTKQVLLESPFAETMRTFADMLCIVCVNVFVMISGWFGIRPSVKGVSNFLFQIIFFMVGTYCVTCLCGIYHLSLGGIAQCLLLLPNNWFVKAYLLLYVLSPVLNAYVSTADHHVQRAVLMAFFGFQFIYGWTFPGTDSFDRGYTTLSFIGLYLLMQYIRKSENKIFNYRWGMDMALYVACSIVSALLYIGVTLYRGSAILQLTAYNSPLVILASLYLFLAFSKMHFCSKVVNKLAKSSFAVYLLHASPFVLMPIYVPMLQHVYAERSGVMCMVMILGVITAFYISALAIDQIRLLIWNRLVNYMKI